MKDRLHRERTKIYIKELETEVLRLRRSEAVEKARSEALQKQVNILLQTLSANGVAPPSNWNVEPQSISPTLPTEVVEPEAAEPVSFLSEADQAQFHSNIPGPITPAFDPTEPSIQIMPFKGTLSMYPSYFYSHATGAPQGDPAQGFPFNDPQAEIDFIMTCVSNSDRLGLAMRDGLSQHVGDDD